MPQKRSGSIKFFYCGNPSGVSETLNVIFAYEANEGRAYVVYTPRKGQFEALKVGSLVTSDQVHEKIIQNEMESAVRDYLNNPERGSFNFIYIEKARDEADAVEQAKGQGLEYKDTKAALSSYFNSKNIQSGLEDKLNGPGENRGAVIRDVMIAGSESGAPLVGLVPRGKEAEAMRVVSIAAESNARGRKVPAARYNFRSN